MNGLNEVRNLQSLNLGGNQISSMDGISKLSKLMTLYLNKNNISDLSEISKLKLNVSLCDLDLSDNPITQIDHYRDQILNILPNLKWLDRIPVVQSEKSRSPSPFGLKRK